MTAERKQSKRGKWLLVLAGCALFAGLLAITLMRPHGETITFRFVDRDSGLPVTNVTVSIHEQWTRLPLEKLRVRGLRSWRSRERICDTGTISVPLRFSKAKGEMNPRSWFGSPQFAFEASGYESAALVPTYRDHGLILSGFTRREEVTVVTNLITIPLQRQP